MEAMMDDLDRRWFLLIVPGAFAISLLGAWLWVTLIHIPVWYAALGLVIVWALIAVMFILRRNGD